MVALLRYLAVHPDDQVHLRGLEHLFGQQSESFQRDLRALVELGALRRVALGRRVDYEIVRESALWSIFRSLLGEFSDPTELVREALRGIAGVDAAFVYGSQAKGTARADSDVDLFVLGDTVDKRALHRSLMQVAVLTGRQVNPGLYTRMKLAEALGSADAPSRRFLREVLAGPKRWIAGAAEALRPIATAADVPFTTSVEP